MVQTLAILLLLLTVSGADYCYADVKDELHGINKEIREKKLLLNKAKKVENRVSDELGVI